MRGGGLIWVNGLEFMIPSGGQEVKSGQKTGKWLLQDEMAVAVVAQGPTHLGEPPTDPFQRSDSSADHENVRLIS